MKVLFVCSQNMLRSPTGEAVFQGYRGIETRSAGTSEDAEKPVTAEMIAWADMVFAMENLHRRLLTERFARELEGKTLITLQIPDDYMYMDEALVELLAEKVTPYVDAALAAKAVTEEAR